MTESPILALQQQRILLEIEYNVDKEEHRRQMEAKGLERLATKWLLSALARPVLPALTI